MTGIKPGTYKPDAGMVWGKGLVTSPLAGRQIEILDDHHMRVRDASNRPAEELEYSFTGEAFEVTNPKTKNVTAYTAHLTADGALLIAALRPAGPRKSGEVNGIWNILETLKMSTSPAETRLSYRAVKLVNVGNDKLGGAAHIIETRQTDPAGGMRDMRLSEGQTDAEVIRTGPNALSVYWVHEEGWASIEEEERYEIIDDAWLAPASLVFRPEPESHPPVATEQQADKHRTAARKHR